MALAANQLVQGLLDLLDNSSVAPQRRDAQQYAAQYIRDLHRAQGGQLPTRVARQLADRVQVLDASVSTSPYYRLCRSTAQHRRQTIRVLQRRVSPLFHP